jgi:hypothetical protein
MEDNWGDEEAKLEHWIIARVTTIRVTHGKPPDKSGAKGGILHEACFARDRIAAHVGTAFSDGPGPALF